MAEQTLGQMVIKLSLDSSAFGSGLAAAQKAAKNTMAEMKADMAIAAAAGDKIGVLQAKQTGLMKEVEAQARVMKKAQEDYNKSFDKTTGLATRDTAAKAKAFNDAAAKLAQFQKQVVQAAGQEAVLKVKTTGVTGAINTMGKGLTSAGKSLSSFGTKATMGVTVPIVAAFAAATKKAMEFQNQLITIKNLLVTSGESGAQAMHAVSTMQKDAVTLSNHYGVSVQKISQGYEDLVRRGYSGAQAVGAMKTMLQGALASGDDFNDVVKVASETMESFGMRLDKNGKQLQSSSAIAKRTKVAVNELAYAADATATDFNSLGLGMSYVGSSAHQAGFSLAETSAAMGVLSNNGLSAQKAGTGLRKVVISLTTAVGKINSKNSVLAKLGIKKSEMVDANGSLKNMSSIMAVLARHTAGMSSVEKGTVFNSLFGTTGQQAGIILTNNAKALSELTGQVEKASKTNYVNALSQKNLASAQNQMRVFKETLNNLGMVLANDVLPTITPLMGDVKDLADKFAHLDPEMRKNIVKWLAITAAVAPFSKVLGIASQMLGKTSTGMVKMIANVAKWKAETNAAKGVVGLTNKLLGITGTNAAAAGKGLEQGAQTFSQFAASGEKLLPTLGATAPAITATGEAVSGAAATTGGLVSANTALIGTLSAVGLGAIAVGAAVGIGWLAWEKWGKKSYEAQQRADYWGTSVDAATDKAAKGFQGYEQDATQALSSTNTSAKDTAKQLDTAFKKMLDSATDNTVKAKKEIDKAVKEIGGKIGKDVEKDLKGGQEKKNNALADMVALYNKEKEITAGGKKLTADQKIQIANLQEQMASSWVKTLSVSASKQKQILSVMQGNYTKLTSEQINESLTSMRGGFEKQASAEKEQLEALEKVQSQYKKNGDMSTYYKRKRQIENDYYKGSKTALTDYARAYMDSTKKSDAYVNGSATQRKAIYNADVSVLRHYLTETLGLTKSQADAIIKASKKQQKAAETTSIALHGLSGDAKAAATAWNGIVLDPKTGQVKTNAQEEVTKAQHSAEGWNNMKLLIKEGKMTTNAAGMVAQAAIANKDWSNLKWVVAHAKLNDDTKVAIATALASNGQWEKTDWKTAKMLAVSKTGAATIQALADLAEWNNMPVEIQQLIAKSKTKTDLLMSLADTDAWNNASEATKTAILKALDKASDPAHNAKNAVDSFPEVTKKALLQVTYLNKHIDQYSKIYEESRKMSDADRQFMGYKNGTGDFRGGPAIVNDQAGPVFRELIDDPNLGTFIPTGHDVLIPNLSRHAKIYPAGKTARLYPGLPQFADGLNVPANAAPLTLAGDVVRSIQPVQTPSVNVSMDASSTNGKLDVMIALLTKLLSKDANLVLPMNQIYESVNRRMGQQAKMNGMGMTT